MYCMLKGYLSIRYTVSMDPVYVNDLVKMHMWCLSRTSTTFSTFPIVSWSCVQSCPKTSQPCLLDKPGPIKFFINQKDHWKTNVLCQYLFGNLFLGANLLCTLQGGMFSDKHQNYMTIETPPYGRPPWARWGTPSPPPGCTPPSPPTKNIIKMGRLTAIVRYESNAPLLLFRRETFEEPGHLEKDQRGRLHP